MSRYEILGACRDDEDDLLKLARFLNTVNLPDDRASVRSLLSHAEQSFRGDIPPAQRKFVFVLWDRVEKAAVGTSMIVAQHGRPDAPYIYLDVIPEEKYSKAVDKHFRHLLLRLGFSYDGPTEIGGLVVHPEYRRVPQRLGLMISYVRFLYIAVHRELFQNYVLAELLPPLEADGTSHLWEALGRHFTDMSYAEADFLSSRDKTFIKDLFPSGAVNASLLAPEARAVIGQVGQQTKGVEKMLRRVGFRYVDRVDPFDGGPHFAAQIDDVTLVRATSKKTVTDQAIPGDPFVALVARDETRAPYFRAIRATISSDDTSAQLSPDDRAALKCDVSDTVIVLPLR